MWTTPKVGIRTPSEWENPFWDSDVFRMTDLDDWIMANIEDKNEIIIGDIVFDDIDEISWAAPLFIVNPRQTGLIQVNASSATIGDGQFAYLLVPRPYQNATLTMQVGSPPFLDESVVPIGYRKGTEFYIKGRGAGGGGDFYGPAGATADAIVAFDGASGKLGKDTPSKVVDTSTFHGLEFSDPDSPTTFYRNIGTFYNPPNGGGGTEVVAGDSLLSFHIRCSVVDPVIEKSGSPDSRMIHEEVAAGWNVQSSGKFSQPGADTAFVLERESAGTNGALSALFIGDRDPNGSVTGDPGDEYVRVDGVDTARYIHTGASSSNSDWTDMVTGGGDFSGPASSDQYAVVIYADTGGKTGLNSVAKVIDISNRHKLQLSDPDSPTTWHDVIQEQYVGPNGFGGTYVAVGNDDQPLCLRTSGGLVATTGDSYPGVPANILWEGMGASWHLQVSGHISQAVDDGTDILELENTGANAGTVVFRAGDRDPEGNVTANPNTVYFREAAGSSGIYYKQSGTGSAGWIVLGPAAGDFNGPAGATQDALVAFADATGKLGRDTPTKVIDTATQHALQFSDPNAPSSFYDVGGIFYTTGTWVQIGDAAIQTRLLSSADPEVDVGAAGWTKIMHEGISAGWNVQSSGKFSQPGADTAFVLERESVGTNGEISALFIGDRDPNGNVTGDPGDEYVRVDGVDTTRYIHTGAAPSNSDWTDLATGGDFSGPASSDQYAVVIYADTGGKTGLNSVAKVIDISNRHKLQLSDPDSPTTWHDVIQEQYVGPNGFGGTYVAVGNDDQPLCLRTSGGLVATTGDSYPGVPAKILWEGMDSSWHLQVSGHISQAVDDGTDILKLENTGTNPGTCVILAGNRSPESNVTAAPMVVYAREDATESALYVKETGAGNTGWSNLINPNVGFYGKRDAGTQTIAASTEAKVEYPNKQDDPGGDFSTTTDVFTAPTKGTYAFSASGTLTLANKGNATLRLYHNTTLVAENSSRVGATGAATPNVSIARVQMNAADTMEVRAYQTSTANATLQNTGLNFSGVQLRKDT